MSETFTHVTTVLLAEQKVLDALRSDPEATSDPTRVADLDAWQKGIDARRYIVQEARNVFANTHYTPIKKYRFAKYFFDKIMMKGPNGWEVFPGNADNMDPRFFAEDLRAIDEDIDNHLNREFIDDVVTGYVLGSYQAFTHLTLTAPIYTIITGVNEFGQEASRGYALVELGIGVLLIKLPSAVVNWGASGFAWARRPGFALPTFRSVGGGRVGTLPPRWGHLGKATVNQAFGRPNIADSAWVHFGSSTIRGRVAQNGVIGNGGRSYWVKWGEVKNMTQGELRWKIGESTVSGTSDLRVMVEAPQAATIREVPGNYGFRAEGVAEGAVQGGRIREAPAARLSAETAGGRLAYPSTRVNQGIDAGTIQYWRGQATGGVATGTNRVEVIAATDRKLANLDANVAVARARGVPDAVITRVLTEARSQRNLDDAIDYAGYKLEIEAAVANGERILVAADEAALFGQFATTPHQRSTAQVFDHGVISTVMAKAALESRGTPQNWTRYELQVVGAVLRRMRQGESVGGWKRVEVTETYEVNPTTGNRRNVQVEYNGLVDAFSRNSLGALEAVDWSTVRVVRPPTTSQGGRTPAIAPGPGGGRSVGSRIETRVEARDAPRIVIPSRIRSAISETQQRGVSDSAIRRTLIQELYNRDGTPRRDLPRALRAIEQRLAVDALLLGGVVNPVETPFAMSGISGGGAYAPLEVIITSTGDRLARCSTCTSSTTARPRHRSTSREWCLNRSKI